MSDLIVPEDFGNNGTPDPEETRKQLEGQPDTPPPCSCCRRNVRCMEVTRPDPESPVNAQGVPINMLQAFLCIDCLIDQPEFRMPPPLEFQMRTIRDLRDDVIAIARTINQMVDDLPEDDGEEWKSNAEGCGD